MWADLGKLIGGMIGSLFKGIWATISHPKTAADQRAADEAETVKDANDAIKTEQKIDSESLGAVQSDLDKRVRDPNS